MIKVLLISFFILKSVNLSDVTFYEVLGISKQATTQEIKHAYKKLAIKLHPDKNPNATDQQKFLKITEAYETLKDPEKRHKYDLYGSQHSYTRKYDYHSQTEYNNLYNNGLYHGDPYVDTLSSSSFSTYLNNGLFFINFYSPFCPPCQSLADHWKKLAEIYKGIVKVAAVNCKYYNSFCYNSMRINSYPSLLFYPNGKNGHYIYYRGPHTFEALEKFMMTYIRNNAYVRRTSQLHSTDKPIAYVVDTDSLDSNALTRIAYRLKGLVTILEARDDLAKTLAVSPETVIVFKYKQIQKEIQSADENNIVKEIVYLLPTVEKVTHDKMKKIRNQLRSGHNTAWVLHFFKKGDENLQLHQLRLELPDLHFGEINCDELNELCNSLQVEETPAFGVLKPGGAYQRVWVATSDLIRAAADAINLHTLSLSDLTNILNDDMSTWVLLVVPNEGSWDHVLEPFTQASLELADSSLHFGIMVCTRSAERACHQLMGGPVGGEPALLVRSRTARDRYTGEMDGDDIVQFIHLLQETKNLELTEEQAIAAASAEHTLLIAYFPAHCGTLCDQLLHEWRIVAKRSRPLSVRLRCGFLRCGGAGGLCGNVRTPVARLYPGARRPHYVVNLQHLSKAPYILEWAFDFISDSIVKLNWQAFSKSVIAEELNPSRSRKPWLVYFHSPRCYRCYEMFPDFAITALILKDSLQFGKVNCVSDYALCQHEHINSYPSLRLYLHRNGPSTPSRVVALPVQHYTSLVQNVRPHIARYDVNLLENIDLDLESRFFHDEL